MGINGSINIPSMELIKNVRSPGLDATVQALQNVQIVIFNCLISRHRAPQCAKFYKEKLNQLQRQQEVFILEGGYWTWRDVFRGNPNFIADDEDMTSEEEHRQQALGIRLGEQFIAQNQNDPGSQFTFDSVASTWLDTICGSVSAKPASKGR